MDERSTIAEFLVNHKASKAVSFHMPGHKGRESIFVQCGYGDFFKNMVGNDITEIPGADNLHDPKGTIARVKENYAALYGVKYTELLINGSSAGIIASILATVPRGGKLILGRNSHHSVFSAMKLGGITPVYLRPETDRESGMQTFISPDELRSVIGKNTDASAVLITSPNYFGVLSDIGKISEICHEYNMPLIVDEAHGAHLVFFDRDSEHRFAAENLGADVVVCSTHKTLLSFTGTGILNVCSDRVDIVRIREYLSMIQTTSPSYPLIGSLDINERIMRRHSTEMVRSWKQDLIFFYCKSKMVPGLDVFTHPMLDMTKINLSMASLGISGEKLGRELRYRNIWVEMVHGDYVMLMTGAGNNRSDYAALIDALNSIASEYGVGRKEKVIRKAYPDFDLEIREIPEAKERVSFFQTEGRVMASPIIIYPPGYPVICPGELMTFEVISYISNALSNGDSIVGIDGDGYVEVGIE
ncbi:MAG: aminotransferase class V-fold PLP-dependent enzyme [Mogibacterium sp.]|nr:aminotransferase class V-fold PLP-dependent enzyme [Mogibacterium sp.]